MVTSAPLEPSLEPQGFELIGVSGGMTVADFGAGGSANWAVKLAELVGPDGQVIMFDVRKAALTTALNMVALRNVKNCQGVWSNLEIYQGAKGVTDGTFDAGIMINLLNETRHPKDVLAEIHRMLKTGARLLIVDWAIDSTHRLAPPHERRMAMEFIESLAKTLGYATVTQFVPSPNYWGLVLARD